ncbi:MAG: Sec-independent protein translocase protein TatA [Candidatus Gottesmanbacteria bacterium GW2011_GWA1_48_13]|uniref:Sec-independent protein translocase protein TatA n=1 Tax=Candidatus Gottesmanbacteria bacterium GW2011_GWA1_48_13 TaxID=1618439 RepID=A0A0G1XN55_9BACT|nr:MAG: Sec-independent protein translocase protein TatA [Candidatus Gottesmanbacteria bacterium GW2011_GWA1_48_13]
MLKSIGTTEWIIIAFIILLLFGGKKIPEFFKGLAEAVKEFKIASKDTGKKETES